MVGVGVIIVGHGWCWCNNSMVGVGVIIGPWLVLV